MESEEEGDGVSDECRRTGPTGTLDASTKCRRAPSRAHGGSTFKAEETGQRTPTAYEDLLGTSPCDSNAKSWEKARPSQNMLECYPGWVRER